MDFSELYLTYYSKLVRFAKEFVILEEDAENITQDVFTDLWAKRDFNHKISPQFLEYELIRPPPIECRSQ